MCGIVGYVGGRAIERSTLEASCRSLAHRGPDGTDTWVDESAPVGLSHRRLAILDLSEAGRQPMVSASGRYRIVYNGEIYNHLGLASNPAVRIGVLSGLAMRPDGGAYRVYRTQEAGDGLGVQPVRMTPSSFSLVPTRTFRELGRFYDDFFIDHIDVVRRGKVRRAKLYYLRDLRGKAARIKERDTRNKAQAAK